MTSHHSARVARSHSWLAALGLGLAPLLAACAAAAPPVHLPAKTAATAPAKAAAASDQRPDSARQQVVAAFLGYTTAMTDAFNSRSAAEVRQLLQPYLDAATVRNAIKAFGQAWAKHEVSYGQVQRHIIGVRILGNAAWVHDCDNTSNSGLEYAGTSQIVQGSLGTADDNVVTRLNRVHGHWVVYVQTIEDLPCRP
jgi:hypothetical protein